MVDRWTSIIIEYIVLSMETRVFQFTITPVSIVGLLMIIINLYHSAGDSILYVRYEVLSQNWLFYCPPHFFL